MDVKVENNLEKGKKTYYIEGPIFFTTANRLMKTLDSDNDPEIVEVIFGYSSLMDYTAISTLHRIASDYAAKKKHITFSSLNLSSQKLVEKANDLVRAIKFPESAEYVAPKVLQGSVDANKISKLPEETTDDSEQEI